MKSYADQINATVSSIEWFDEYSDIAVENWRELSGVPDAIRNSETLVYELYEVKIKDDSELSRLGIWFDPQMKTYIMPVLPGDLETADSCSEMNWENVKQGARYWAFNN